MGWYLFLDESGQDGRNSPYEVLAGLAVEDRQLWKLIQALKLAQEENFGLRLFDAYGVEAKGQKLLKRKTFKHAAQKATLLNPERASLAKAALEDGAAVHGDQLTALAQAKLAYVEQAFRLCRQHAEHAGSAFITIPVVNLMEILCIRDERQVGNDNTVTFRRHRLQIPESLRPSHFVKARVRIQQYHSRTKPIFHGPRRLAYLVVSMDKAYDVEKVRQNIKDEGNVPVIPSRSNATKHARCPKRIDDLRHKVENYFRDAIDWSRIAISFHVAFRHQTSSSHHFTRSVCEPSP